MRGNITCERAQRIARIAVLLGELEALSREAQDVPAPLLGQARASIERARGLLKSCGTAAPAEEVDSDPQPDVDNDLLERMYRKLSAGRRPPER
jgi:hypothetical protein